MTRHIESQRKISIFSPHIPPSVVDFKSNTICGWRIDADLGRRNYSLLTDKIEAKGYHAIVSLYEGLFELISTVRKLKVDKSYFNSGFNEYTRSSRLLPQQTVVGGFP